jgi:hypothetical protein
MPLATVVTTTDQKTPLNNIWDTFTVGRTARQSLLGSENRTASST